MQCMMHYALRYILCGVCVAGVVCAVLCVVYVVCVMCHVHVVCDRLRMFGV